MVDTFGSNGLPTSIGSPLKQLPHRILVKAHLQWSVAAPGANVEVRHARISVVADDSDYLAGRDRITNLDADVRQMRENEVSPVPTL